MAQSLTLTGKETRRPTVVRAGRSASGLSPCARLSISRLGAPRTVSGVTRGVADSEYVGLDVENITTYHGVTYCMNYVSPGAPPRCRWPLPPRRPSSRRRKTTWAAPPPSARMRGAPWAVGRWLLWARSSRGWRTSPTRPVGPGPPALGTGMDRHSGNRENSSSRPGAAGQAGGTQIVR